MPVMVLPTVTFAPSRINLALIRPGEVFGKLSETGLILALFRGRAWHIGMVSSIPIESRSLSRSRPIPSLESRMQLS